jgi:hypothetical protein
MDRAVRTVTAVREIGALMAVLTVGAGCKIEGARDDASHRDAGRFMPETVGAVSLHDPDVFPPELREAAAAAALRLTQDGSDPSLSFAQIARVSDDEVVIHIWPAAKFGGRKPRGGGGKSLTFSRKAHKITRGVAWQ